MYLPPKNDVSMSHFKFNVNSLSSDFHKRYLRNPDSRILALTMVLLKISPVYRLLWLNKLHAVDIPFPSP